jgi:hypothetical protein
LIAKYIFICLFRSNFSYFSFMCMFINRCSFSFWPLCCLSFDLWILITPLVTKSTVWWALGLISMDLPFKYYIPNSITFFRFGFLKKGDYKCIHYCYTSLNFNIPLLCYVKYFLIPQLIFYTKIWTVIKSHLLNLLIFSLAVTVSFDCKNVILCNDYVMCKMLLRFLVCYLKEKENNNFVFITVYGTMIFPHFDPQYCYDRMAIWKSFNCELSAEFYAHCFCISKITMNSIKTEWPSWPWSYGSWIYTTTYAICAYHLWCCEFESCSGRGVQHYVIKFVSDLRQVGGFLRTLRFPPPIKLTYNWNIVESGVKHHKTNQPTK